VKAALELCAAGKVIPELEILHLKDINEALDKIKSGKVMGKIVLDLKTGMYLLHSIS